MTGAELIARLRDFKKVTVWDVRDAADRIEALTKERDEGMTEALSLAKSLHEQFYQEQVPQWEPLEDVAGVISQIDNMVAGIAEQLAAARQDVDEVEAYAWELEQRLPTSEKLAAYRATIEETSSHNKGENHD